MSKHKRSRKTPTDDEGNDENVDINIGGNNQRRRRSPSPSTDIVGFKHPRLRSPTPRPLAPYTVDISFPVDVGSDMNIPVDNITTSGEYERFVFAMTSLDVDYQPLQVDVSSHSLLQTWYNNA